MSEAWTGSDEHGSHGTAPDQAEVIWLERTLSRVMRRLIDAENLDMPLLQLPLAQLRLAQALYRDQQGSQQERLEGETMGRLSERLRVRHNALTQVADRLISHGLAERFSDPDDRRVVRMRLTETGREWVGARRARRRAHLSGLWNSLELSERAQFIEAVRTLEAVGERLGSTPQAGEESPIEETLSHLIADSTEGFAPGPSATPLRT